MITKGRLLLDALLIVLMATLLCPKAKASVYENNGDPSVYVDVTVRTTHWAYQWYFDQYLIDNEWYDTYALYNGDSLTLWDQYGEYDYWTFEVMWSFSYPDPSYNPGGGGGAGVGNNDWEDRGEHPEIPSFEVPGLGLGFSGPGGVRVDIQIQGKYAPAGKVWYYLDYVFASEKGAVGPQIFDLIAWMKQHSQTFRETIDRERNRSTHGITFIPISGVSGGKTSQDQVAFGILSTKNRAGKVLWPAKVVAHEVGHLDERYGNYPGGYHPDWVKDVSEFSDTNGPAFQFAPDNHEYYATKFANLVAAEILADTGVDIGSVEFYDDSDNLPEDRGILPSGVLAH